MSIEFIKDASDNRFYVIATAAHDHPNLFAASALKQCSLGSIKMIYVAGSNHTEQWLKVITRTQYLFATDLKVTRIMSSGLIGNSSTGQMSETMSETMKHLVLQKLMGDLQKMNEMLSNMQKSLYDMQMTPIRAMRG